MRRFKIITGNIENIESQVNSFLVSLPEDAVIIGQQVENFMDSRGNISILFFLTYSDQPTAVRIVNPEDFGLSVTLPV
jgi:hypothetical protein